MRDMSRHTVVLLMNVAVEDCDVFVGHERVNDVRAIARRPIPLRVEIKKWTVCEHHDARVRLLPFEIGLQPVDLSFTHKSLRVRDIVEDDEMHALMIEGV